MVETGAGAPAEWPWKPRPERGENTRRFRREPPVIEAEHRPASLCLVEESAHLSGARLKVGWHHEGFEPLVPIGDEGFFVWARTPRIRKERIVSAPTSTKPAKRATA